MDKATRTDERLTDRRNAHGLPRMTVETSDTRIIFVPGTLDDRLLHYPPLIIVTNTTESDRPFYEAVVIEHLCTENKQFASHGCERWTVCSCIGELLAVHHRRRKSDSHPK